MSRKVGALVLAVAALTAATAAVAHGGSTAAQQRIALKSVGSGFQLVPLTSGALKKDTGSATFCCWTDHEFVRDGQNVDVTTGPRLTLVGRQGTIIASNRMEWLDVPGGIEIFTGTWKIVSGTGAYSGLAGGGRVAGIKFANDSTRWQREGVVSLR